MSEARNFVKRRSFIESAVTVASLLIVAGSLFLAGIFIGYEAGINDQYVSRNLPDFQISGVPRSAWTIFVKWYVIQAILMSVLSYLVWNRVRMYWARLLTVILMFLPLYRVIGEKWEMITIRGAGDIWLVKPTIMADILTAATTVGIAVALLALRLGFWSEKDD